MTDKWQDADAVLDWNEEVGVTHVAFPSWEDVDFGCSTTPRAPEESTGIDVPPAVTNIEVQEFAKEHFPDGPGSAIAAQDAWVAYQDQVAAEKEAAPKKFFYRSETPMPKAAEPWDGLVRDWANHCIDHRLSEGRRLLASIDWTAGVALNQPSQERKASWRDRRSAAQGKASEHGRGRNRG